MKDMHIIKRAFDLLSMIDCVRSGRVTRVRGPFQKPEYLLKILSGSWKGDQKENVHKACTYEHVCMYVRVYI